MAGGKTMFNRSSASYGTHHPVSRDHKVTASVLPPQITMPDTFMTPRTIRPAAQCSHCRSTAGLGSNSHQAPHFVLRFADSLVLDQHDVVDKTFGERKHDLSHALRRQRVRGDASCLRIDRTPRLARPIQRWSGSWLNGDDPDSPR